LIASFVIGATPLLARDEPKTAAGLTPVQAIVTVEARQGKDVPALKPGDVMVQERHQRLQVTDLAGDSGLELFLLVDDASDTSLGSQLGDLRHFIDTQPASTAIGIGYMSHGSVDIVQNLTTDHAAAAHALRIPFWSAGANPYLSLSDLAKRWPSSSARREVVMVTSGEDSLAAGLVDPYLTAAIEDAQRNGIVVYAIYMPTLGHAAHSLWRLTWAQSHLEQLAEETGGESYILGPEAPVSLEPYLESIAKRLAHQYRVTFLIKPERKPEFREVKFTTEVPNAELVAAKNVYVAGSRELGK